MARGRLAIPQNLVARRGRGGLYYSKYGPLLPVISLPGYFVGSLFDSVAPAPGEHRYGWGDRLALATNQWISAGIIVLLYDAGLVFGARRWHALWFGFLVACSTMILPYSRDYFTQPSAAFCVAMCGYCLLRYQMRPDWKWLFYASGSFGLGILARMDLMACLPGFAVWAVLLLRRHHQTQTPGTNRVFLLLPFFLCTLFLLLFDGYRWGGGAGTPYGNQQFNTPLLDSLPRFLFGADLSVFLYNPLLIVALVLTVLTWKDFGVAWAGILVGDILYLLLVSKFEDYHGGVCPGPRYLLSLVPLTLLPLAVGLGRFSHRGWLPPAVLALVSLPGILLNGYAALVDYTTAATPWEYWVGILR